MGAPLTFSTQSISNFPSGPLLSDPFSCFPIPASERQDLTKLHYLLCNEEGQEALLRNISLIASRPNSIYLGFSCWLNFDLIAQRKPSYAVIFDCDPQMIALLHLMREKVIESNNPLEFVTHLWSALELNPSIKLIALIGIESCLSQMEFKEHVLNKTGWLSTQDSFEWVKEMYRSNRLIHRELDVNNTEAIEKVLDWMRSKNLLLDAIYLSNIIEWVEDKKLLELNTLRLIDSASIVISAWKKTMNRPELEYKIGGFPKFHQKRPSKPSFKVINTGIPKRLKFSN